MEILFPIREADRAAAGRKSEKGGGFFKFRNGPPFRPRLRSCSAALSFRAGSGVAWGKVVEARRGGFDRSGPQRYKHEGIEKVLWPIILCLGETYVLCIPEVRARA